MKKLTIYVSFTPEQMDFVAKKMKNRTPKQEYLGFWSNVESSEKEKISNHIASTVNYFLDTNREEIYFGCDETELDVILSKIKTEAFEIKIIHRENWNLMEEDTVMKKYKIAAILMIIHGGFMELGGIFAMIPALLIGTDKYDIGQYFEFKLPYFQDNLYMMMVMGAIYGVFRLIGAIGLLKNRMWGLVLSVINCVITIALMMFLLPAGIMDGILAGSALILILMQYFGDKKIVE